MRDACGTVGREGRGWGVGGVYLEFWGGSGGESGPLAVEQYNLLSGLSTRAKEKRKDVMYVYVCEVCAVCCVERHYAGRLRLRALL